MIGLKDRPLSKDNDRDQQDAGGDHGGDGDD